MSARTIKLLIIDDDPIFRLGLCTALESRDLADLQIVAQGETDLIAKILEENIPDLLILAIDINGLVLCKKILEKYPDLNIVLLTSQLNQQQLILAKSYGVKGYVAKGTKIRELVNALRQVAYGETYWQNQPGNYSHPIKLNWLARQCQSGLAQITFNLERVERNLNQPKLPLIDYLFWRGRKRELLAASWLVKQLFPVDAIALAQDISGLYSPQAINPLPSIYRNLESLKSEGLLAKTNLENTLIKLHSLKRDFTPYPLEIDVLKSDKRQELLLIVLDKINKTLQKISQIGTDEQELSAQSVLILQEIWQASALEFLSRYYIFQQENQDSNIFSSLNEQRIIIQREVLQKIPLIQDYLAYLLFDKPLVIDRVAYRNDSPEVRERVELLLQNLIVNIANGVMIIVLNDLNIQGNTIKTIYHNRFLSSRELARFRNELSWRYWKEKYWEEPRDIFEDRYSLLVFEDDTIRKIYINHTRQEELEQLKSIAWLLTILIEAQDALVPRMRTLIDWIGRGLVYILTEIIGRGIGLIGRGILQGIGNSLQRNKE